MRRCFTACVVFLLFLGMQCASAQAGGGRAYPNGAEGAFAAMVPPPGFTFINYMYYYRADDLKDNNGDDIDVFDNASVYAEVMRFIWVSNLKVLGADYGQHLFVPILHTDINFSVPLGPRGKKHYSDTNLPYLIYSPAFFAWHACQGTVHTVLGLADTFIPLYNEDEGNLASIGRNFWTVEPVFGVTWLPTKKWELSIKLGYDFNTEQEDYPHPSGLEFDRVPGQEFHFDYNASYAILENWRLGAGGYFYHQVTEDDFDLDGFPAPVRRALEESEDDLSRVWAIGPGVWYQHKNMFFELRSQFEASAENITQGFNTWFKFIYLF